MRHDKNRASFCGRSPYFSAPSPHSMEFSKVRKFIIFNMHERVDRVGGSLVTWVSISKLKKKKNVGSMLVSHLLCSATFINGCYSYRD